MLQFYFLAVLLNVMAGLILVYAADFTRGTSLGAPADGMADDMDAGDAATGEPADEKDDRLFAHESFMNDSLFRLVVGILAVFSGVLLFVSPVQDDAPVVGDLVPALACICGGAALLLEFYANKLSTEIRLPFFLQAVMVTGRRYLGVFCIIAGIVHFIFPRVMFL